jgi:beta-fructofuranosidase
MKRFSWSFMVFLLAPFVAVGDQAAFDAAHDAELAKANAAVAEAVEAAQADRHYPIYHLRTAAYWINDPNGPVHFDGHYHMFFQHNPYGPQWGNMSWGYAVSRDLVYWEHRPIALGRNPDSYDKDGVFSGCCVIADDGTPTILYTGVNPQVQAIATTQDGGRTWQKHPANPVIADPPLPDLEGFRDPYVWREEDGWYMVIGGGIRGEGGAALLYRSPDLVAWEYLHPLAVGFAKNWECPNFFPLGGRHVLIVSPHGDVRYTIGDYDKAAHTFAQGEWRRLDIAEDGPFYAPNSFFAPDGRLLLWGWIRGGGSEDAPWNGCLTLPRVLTLRDDGLLGIAPADEITGLRREHAGVADVTVEGRDGFTLEGTFSSALEVAARIGVGNAENVEIILRGNREGVKPVEIARIIYDNIAHKLRAGAHAGDFQLLPGEEELQLRVFLDRSVLEVYANGRAALTTRVYPEPYDSVAVSVAAKSRAAQLHRLDVWNLGSIWDAPGETKESSHDE